MKEFAARSGAGGVAPRYLDLKFSGLGRGFARPMRGAENRAITLAQLRALWAFAAKHADADGVLTGWHLARTLVWLWFGIGAPHDYRFAR